MRYLCAVLVGLSIIGCGRDEPPYGTFCVLQTPISVPIAGKWYASWRGSIYKTDNTNEWTDGIGRPIPPELSNELAELFDREEWWEYPVDSLPLCMITYQEGRVWQSAIVERGRSTR